MSIEVPPIFFLEPLPPGVCMFHGPGSAGWRLWKSKVGGAAGPRPEGPRNDAGAVVGRWRFHGLSGRSYNMSFWSNSQKMTTQFWVETFLFQGLGLLWISWRVLNPNIWVLARWVTSMSEVTGSLSTPASPQSAVGPELSWFKIPYWLKGDEETRPVSPKNG